ncbi:hypothetical protein BCR42DRAFT_438970 [Absidia repens]|uniref:Nicotinamide-nucleotide adenylyltransferase n=1 Tax=Absidia repens TaxID=90262 RepID=A0A1X2ICL7_9FUNG|nr:hypothetical protein BCR42DRAFT_438970 [Absidia repens]
MSLYNAIRQRTDLLTSTIQKHLFDDFFLTFEPATSNSTWYTTTKETLPLACRRLLILDSSFNPPTKAHAALLKKALQAHPSNYFDASLLLFSSKNADKELTARRKATSSLGCPVYVGLTRHAKFIDKATSIQQWYHHNQQHPSSSSSSSSSSPLELHFILGYDTVTRLLEPKYYQPLTVKQALDPFFSHCYLICADRPGFADDTTTTSFWQSDLVRGYADKITRISLEDQGDIATVSSTLARKAAAATKDPYQALVKFVDEAVADYVVGEKLYQ